MPSKDPQTSLGPRHPPPEGTGPPDAGVLDGGTMGVCTHREGGLTYLAVKPHLSRMQTPMPPSQRGDS